MQPVFDVTPSSPQNRGGQGPITVSNVSDADLGPAMAQVTATGGVLVNFFYARVKIQSKNAAVDGQYQTRLCVAKQPKADRDSVATSYITEEDAKRLFPAEFEAFSRNEELPTNGTPLGDLPGITHQQVGILTLSGLRSIEDLADLTNEQAKEIGYEAVRPHKLAQQWVRRIRDSDDMIKAADVEARYQAEIAERDRHNAAMAEEMAALKAQVSALQSIGGQAGNAQPSMQDPDAIAATGGDENLPDIDDMPNPLAEGSATLEMPDDPLVSGE